MSTIHLTDDLLNGIQNTLIQNDEQTQDIGIAVQYLAAVLGFMVAKFPNQTTQQKRQILNQLCDFANHVLDQNTREEAPSGDTDEAFGIWKPGEEH